MFGNVISVRKRSLFLKILFSRFHFRALIFFISFLAAATSIMIPYFQKEFINTLSIPNVKADNKLIFFIFMAFLCAMLSQLMAFFSKWISYYEASYVQNWLSKITYSKTFRVKESAQGNMTVGQILSVYASDIQTATTLIDDVLPNVTSYLLPIFLAPFAIIFMTSINASSIIALIFCLLSINCLMAMKQGKFFYRNKLFSAIRVGYVNEWLQNMRAIRMLNWIPIIEEKIKKARFSETKNRLAMVTNGSTMNAVGYSAPFFINIFSVYLLLQVEGKNTNPGEIFSLLWIFGVLLTRPLRMFPMSLVSISDCYTSIKRIENYWKIETEPEFTAIQNTDLEKKSCSLKIKNLSYKIGNKMLLEGIDLEIFENEFIAIIGELGSGKTSLISALMNLNRIDFDSYEINNKSVINMSFDEIKSYFTYVPQELFIINSNLRDNIAFEYNYKREDDKEIVKALELAQFLFENENINLGLDTEIGERGVNLSGGQKQRVAIARAYFANRPIVLLDDCLSALDVRTEEKLNKALLNGAWKNKIRILITHRLSILPMCDRVLFMKNGKIIENGSFQEILNRSELVRNFVTTMTIEE